VVLVFREELPKDKFKRLTELHRIETEIQATINSTGNVSNRLDARRRAIVKKMHAGELADVGLPTEQEIERDEHQLRILCDLRLTEIHNEVLEIAKATYPAILEALDKWTAKMIDREAVLHREAGVSYDAQRSYFANSIRSAVESLRRRFGNMVANRTGGAPASVFPFLTTP
jgi:hypothetical protein